MNNLYGNPENGFASLSEPSSSFSFNNDALKAALLRIYQKDFNPLTDIEANLFDATWATINRATDKGLSMAAVAPVDDFVEALKYNNAVFSAFKVHRMQNDIAAQLLDADGKLKPYAQFAKDVAPITTHHVDNWLRTEYDTAVVRAHQAANWQQFEREKHILPHLEWMPSTSVTPGEDHRIFWGTILPVDHSFWNSHRPGDRWNCKCSLRATDKGVTTVPHGDEVNSPANKPAKGLDNNPGIDGKLFSDTHPYKTKAYPGAKKAVGKFLTELTAEGKELFGWVARIKDNGRTTGEFKTVGRMDRKVVRFAKARQLQLPDNNIILSDKAVAHMLRKFKKHPPSTLDVGKIKEYLQQAAVYFDTTHGNFIYFIDNGNGDLLKFVVEPGYAMRHKGAVKKVNYVVTGGYVPKRDLNKREYIKIKD